MLLLFINAFNKTYFTISFKKTHLLGHSIQSLFHIFYTQLIVIRCLNYYEPRNKIKLLIGYRNNCSRFHQFTHKLLYVYVGAIDLQLIKRKHIYLNCLGSRCSVLDLLALLITSNRFKYRSIKLITSTNWIKQCVLNKISYIML